MNLIIEAACLLLLVCALVSTIRARRFLGSMSQSQGKVNENLNERLKKLEKRK